MSGKGWRVVVLVVLTASFMTPASVGASPDGVALSSVFAGWELWSRLEAWFLGSFRTEGPEVMGARPPKPESFQEKEGPGYDPDGASGTTPFPGESIFDDAGPGWDPDG
jgi:hypothetical protein